MNDLFLYAWDISVTLGIFGYGLLGTRLLGLKRSSLAVAGVFGVSLWIALGGFLNLLHLLRPAVFFILVASGFVFLAADLLLRRKDTPSPSDRIPLNLPSKLAVTAAALLILTLIVGVMRVRHWGHDDLEGYLTLGMKATQNYSLQPDPFSERRVQIGVGGGNFLDALMFATGDLRAMDFIDSGFGFGLYALAVWALGRRWNAPPLGIAFTILCLPFATLFKINLTIIYLSAAGFLAVLLLLTDIPQDTSQGTSEDAPVDGPISAGRVIALGIIIGGLLTTKTPNIVFVGPLLLGTVLLYWLFHARRSPLLPLFFALILALATVVPWSIANKATVYTYLYPLLGQGAHVSASHLIWTPDKTGSWQQMVLLTAPNLTFLILCFAVAWNLTSDWLPTRRSAILAYIAAAIVALPVCMVGLGGEDGDRYTAPLVMPVYLLTLLLVLAASSRIAAFWRRAGVATLLAVGLYTVLFIDIRLMWLFQTKIILYEAFGKMPHHHPDDFFLLTEADIQKEFAYGAGIQASIPAGATALDVSRNPFHFNFRRNTIYIADHAGMSSPPPGLPLESGPAVQRQFLVDYGIDYLIFERISDLSCPYNSVLGIGESDWPRFVKDERQHFDFHYFFTHEAFTHLYGPWNITEFEVSCHERTVFAQIVDASPHVYDDGNFVVARIR